MQNVTELNSKKGDRIVEKIGLLPESRYSEEKNGLIKEWLAGDLAKRTEFIYYLEEQYSVKISADIKNKVNKDV